MMLLQSAPVCGKVIEGGSLMACQTVAHNHFAAPERQSIRLTEFAKFFFLSQHFSFLWFWPLLNFDIFLSLPKILFQNIFRPHKLWYTDATKMERGSTGEAMCEA